MLKKSLFIFLAAMFVVAVALPGCCKKAAERLGEEMIKSMNEAADSLQQSVEQAADTLKTEVEKIEEGTAPKPGGGTGGTVKPPTTK